MRRVAKETAMEGLRPVNAEDLPSISPIEVEDYLQRTADIAGLTHKRKAYLKAIVDDYMLESPRSDVDICESIGISRDTALTCRQDPRFNAVLSQVLYACTKGKFDVILSSLFKAARQGKVSAAKLLMEYIGEYTFKMQTLNLHVNRGIMDTNPMDIDAAAEKFLTMLGGRGWSLEMVVDLWHKLKSEQAF